jgi:hypothetical protein
MQAERQGNAVRAKNACTAPLDAANFLNRRLASTCTSIPVTGLPELDEGGSFSLRRQKKREGFDKLSQAGV